MNSGHFGKTWRPFWASITIVFGEKQLFSFYNGRFGHDFSINGHFGMFKMTVDQNRKITVVLVSNKGHFSVKQLVAFQSYSRIWWKLSFKIFMEISWAQFYSMEVLFLVIKEARLILCDYQLEKVWIVACNELNNSATFWRQINILKFLIDPTGLVDIQTDQKTVQLGL